MDKIGLVDTIEALRTELGEAVARARHQEIQFPVGGIELEFHVGVTKDVEGAAGVRFWVLELGSKAGLANETVQTVRITLEPPVDRQGRPVKVALTSANKP